VNVAIDGKRSSLIDQRPAVIIIVPPDCDCDAVVSALAQQANIYRIGVYLVAGPTSARPLPGAEKPTVSPRPATDDPSSPAGSATGTATLRKLARRNSARLLEDEQGVLVSTYRPTGPTAVFVHTDGVVGKVLPGLRADQRFDLQLEPLQRPGQGAGG
jgi:hypothetical protein